MDLVKKTGAPAIAVFNKVDKLRGQAEAAGADRAVSRAARFRRVHSDLRARRATGSTCCARKSSRACRRARRCIPTDYLTDQPERFLAAEILREKILHLTRQEVPHAVAVMIESWEDTREAGAHRRDDLRGAAGAEGDPDRRGRRGAQENRHAWRARSWSNCSSAKFFCRHSSRCGRTGARTRSFWPRSTGAAWPEM